MAQAPQPKPVPTPVPGAPPLIERTYTLTNGQVVKELIDPKGTSAIYTDASGNLLKELPKDIQFLDSGAYNVKTGAQVGTVVKSGSTVQAAATPPTISDSLPPVPGSKSLTT